MLDKSNNVFYLYFFGNKSINSYHGLVKEGIHVKKISFVIVFFIFLVGCSSKEYTNQITKGTESLKEKQYEEALVFFEQAEKIKETEEVKKYCELTEQMVQSKALFKKGQYISVMKQTKEIMEENTQDPVIQIIKKQAKEMIEQSEKLNNEYEQLEEMYYEANRLFYEGSIEETKKRIDLMIQVRTDNPKAKKIIQKAENLERKIDMQNQ